MHAYFPISTLHYLTKIKKEFLLSNLGFLLSGPLNLRSQTEI